MTMMFIIFSLVLLLSSCFSVDRGYATCLDSPPPNYYSSVSIPAGGVMTIASSGICGSGYVFGTSYIYAWASDGSSTFNFDLVSNLDSTVGAYSSTCVEPAGLASNPTFFVNATQASVDVICDNSGLFAPACPINYLIAMQCFPITPQPYVKPLTGYPACTSSSNIIGWTMAGSTNSVNVQCCADGSMVSYSAITGYSHCGALTLQCSGYGATAYTFMEGSLVSIIPGTVTGGSGTYVWSINPPLPIGLNISSITGKISGTASNSSVTTTSILNPKPISLLSTNKNMCVIWLVVAS